MFLHHETFNEFLEMTIKNTIVVSIKRIMYLLYFYYNNSYAYGTDNKALNRLLITEWQSDDLYLNIEFNEVRSDLSPQYQLKD